MINMDQVRTLSEERNISTSDALDILLAEQRSTGKEELLQHFSTTCAVSSVSSRATRTTTASLTSNTRRSTRTTRI